MKFVSPTNMCTCRPDFNATPSGWEDYMKRKQIIQKNMNQARSIYKTDYAPYDWVQNNFTLSTDNFCSVENIDDCLRYISEEFSALGYPSIYSNSSPCPYSVNCDIVKLLNVTFELIGNNKDHAQVKDDLECRNHQLLCDLNGLRKKNQQLNENLEQTDRKYKASLEKERQIKEKNSNLQQLLKSEKDETKKLSLQIQQQKVAYQHEIRKCENNMNQMKTRLNQILSDRNPEKKIATISPSGLLQRNSKQRGKWKTGSAVKSSMEEMYTSVISSYENRCQELMKEVSELRQSLEYIHTQFIETITVRKDSATDDNKWIMDVIPLRAIWNSPNMQTDLEAQFSNLLSQVKENAFEDRNKKTENDPFSMSSMLPQKDEVCLRLPSTQSSTKGATSESDDDSARLNYVKLLKEEREQLDKEKLELSATAAEIEKEKKNLEKKKLEIIKLALQQEGPESQWHQNLHCMTSFSVMTTSKAITTVPSTKQLKYCLSSPDQEVESLVPLWKSESSTPNVPHEFRSKSETTLRTTTPDPSVLETSPNLRSNTAQPACDLPKWAAAALSAPSTSIDSETCALADESKLALCPSNEDLDLSTTSSSEEVNLALLKAAIEDIENRRSHLSL